MACDQGREEGLGVCVCGGGISNRMGKFKLLVLQGDPLAPSMLLTVIILKRLSEIIFFQRTKFTACKIKDGKEMANSLMKFNLLKIIHQFQGKKHLRT